MSSTPPELNSNGFLTVQLQSVRTALEGKASAEQMLELKTVMSEVDKLVSRHLHVTVAL